MKRLSLSLSEETPPSFAFPCKRARLHASIPTSSKADGQAELTSAGFAVGRVLTSESVGRSWVTWKPRAPWYATPPTCNGDDEGGKKISIPGAEPAGRLVPASWHTADAEGESDDESVYDACESNSTAMSLTTSSASQGVETPFKNADHRNSGDFATSSASVAESLPPKQQIFSSEKPAHAISSELPPAEIFATPGANASLPSLHTPPQTDRDATHAESKPVALDSDQRAPPIPVSDAPCSAGVSDRTNTQSPSPADIAASAHLHFHAASWGPQPCTRWAKLRSGERTAARGFIWQCPLCYRQKAMSRDGLIKHLTMMHPSSIRRRIPLTRESIARFDESPTIPDEDFMYVLSAYFSLPEPSGSANAATSL